MSNVGVMSSVDAHLVTQFSSMMHIVAQQARARLRKYVNIKKMTGDVFAYDGLGSIEARELDARFNPTVFDDINHFRRQIAKRRFGITLPMDSQDVDGMLTDPTGQYATAAVKAMERKFDRVVYDAMFATVNTGKTFTTPITATSDGVLTVDATGGLTLIKELEITRNFNDNEVGNDVPVDICQGIAGDEQETLLQIDQFISTRYTTSMALEKGKVTNVAGIDMILFGDSTTEPLLYVDGSNIRYSFAMATGAMAMGLAHDGWTVKISERPDYYGVRQVQIEGTMGAVRTEGKLIQKVNTTKY